MNQASSSQASHLQINKRLLDNVSENNHSRLADCRRSKRAKSSKEPLKDYFTDDQTTEAVNEPRGMVSHVPGVVSAEQLSHGEDATGDVPYAIEFCGPSVLAPDVVTAILAHRNDRSLSRRPPRQIYGNERHSLNTNCIKHLPHAESVSSPHRGDEEVPIFTPPITSSSVIQAGRSHVSKQMNEDSSNIPNHGSVMPEDKVPPSGSAPVSTMVSEFSDVGDTITASVTLEQAPYAPPRLIGQRSTTLGPVRQTAQNRRVERESKAAELRLRKEEEAQEKRMTPQEYAVKVKTKFQKELDKARPENLYLRGKNIFFVGGDYGTATSSTRKKMDVIRRKGGNVIPTYDPNQVSHIVTMASAATVLSTLGLKSLKEIPDQIPVLKWTWVCEGRGKEEYRHAAFSSRIPADSSITPHAKQQRATAHSSTAKPGQSSSGSSSLRDARHDAISPTGDIKLPDQDLPTQSHRGPSNAGQEGRGNEDPLASFYAQAREDHDSQWRQTYDSQGSEDEQERLEMPRKALSKRVRRGFTCDRKNDVDNGPSVNQDIVDLLEELKQIHNAKCSEDDRWRVFSYSKCIPAIRAYPKRITTLEEAMAIKGIGKKTAMKIMEIITTHNLSRIQSERTPEVESMKVLEGVYGVGPTTARMWYQAGCRTLEDVRQRKGNITVSKAQEIGIRFYTDINSRMPREEAKQIFDRIKAIALKIEPKLFIEIMGSYRRGKADCGDIDILITRCDNDGQTHHGVLRRLLQELHVSKILTEDLVLPYNFDDLEATYRGLCQLNSGTPRRRIDILTVPYKYRGAALLYYTGDDIFNRAMRYKAGAMGYSLNQRGLYANVVRDPRNRTKKLSRGVIIASETEEEIFRILNVPWQEPHERVRS